MTPNDQMVCNACGLYWDVNDPDPPACQRKWGEKLPEVVQVTPKRRGFPEELPPDLEREMVKTYKASGMRAAYRLLLDRISPD